MKPPQSPLDELLAQVSQGQEAAFAELYQLTSAKLLAVALRIVRDREVAEEVLQECYVRIWEKASDFNPKIARPITWMAAIVRNRAIDEVRRRGNRVFTDDKILADLESEDEHPLEVLGRQEDVDKLLRCMEGLAPDKRQIVRLAYLEGLSRQELAQRFDKPEGTIKTWLHRSLAQLRGCLEQ